MNITCNSVTKAYGKNFFGVKELTVQINSGEFFVVMGESGCGKSTFLRLLAGLYYPDFGELFLDGIPANSIPPQDRDCAMIFQDYALYPNMTVYDNISFYLKKELKLSQEAIQKRVMPIIEFLGLKNIINVRPRYISGGQQQRVCLAKALVRRPKLLLFDEPLSNVDEKSRDKYLMLIKETKKLVPNTTFVYVTHNAHEARFLADRIGVMLDGKIVDIGTVKELLSHPQVIDTVYLLAEQDLHNGKIEENVFYYGGKSKELGEYERDTLQGNLTNVTCYPDKDYRGYDIYFDKNGKVISGYKKEILIPAKILDYVVDFQEQQIPLKDIQKQRYIGKNGFVNLKLKADKIHQTKIYGDFEINLKFYKNLFDVTLFKVDNKIICLKGEYKQDTTLYYNIEDLILADENGENVSTKYEIKPNVCTGQVKNGFLYIGKNKFETELEDGVYNLELALDCVQEVVEKRELNALLIKECLAEDTLGEYKLVHLIVSEFNTYVTFKVEKNTDLYKSKKMFLLLNPYKIKLCEDD